MQNKVLLFFKSQIWTKGDAETPTFVLLMSLYFLIGLGLNSWFFHMAFFPYEGLGREQKT